MNTNTSPSRDKIARPPGPPARWAGLSWMADMRRDQIGTMQHMQQHHGDIVHVQAVYEHIYMVFSPDMIREVAVDNAQHLVRQERLVEVLREVHGHNLLTSEGQAWQRQHRMLRQGFTPRRVAGYAALMVNAMGQSLAQLGTGNPSGRQVNMSQLMNRLTMDVILRTLFSQPAGAECDQILTAIDVLDRVVMNELFWPLTLPDWLPLPGKAAKRQALAALNGLIAQRIHERRAMPVGSTPGDDLLAMLMDARDEDASPQAMGLSAQEIHDQCKLMFLAGQETTAVAMTWWSWLIASHPAVARQAQQEVDAVLGQREPTADDLPRMPWLTATLKEAMRLYPPAAGLFTRRTKADITVGNWRIPKGSMIYLAHRVAHHDARWFKSPEVFRPERFMPGAEPIPRGAWMPFGAGPRVCMGQHFALLEMGLLAAMLLQRYTLQPDPALPPPVQEVQITLRPTQALQLIVKAR